MNERQALLNALTELAEGVEQHASTLGTQRDNLQRHLTGQNLHAEVEQALGIVGTVVEELVLVATTARSIVSNLDDGTPAATAPVAVADPAATTAPAPDPALAIGDNDNNFTPPAPVADAAPVAPVFNPTVAPVAPAATAPVL